ncbi:hypothetical protein [Micromonospora sp. NPDC093277]|uniref:hypothetical protein n=1 Tax=Micromonospora sp. NPDC093277 TaxID=3364291 RepID=UPI003820257D
MSTHPRTNPSVHSSLPRQPERRRWWHGVFPPQDSHVLAPPPAAVSASFRQDVPQPILVPAKGDAFDFRLHAVYTWTGQNMTYDELRFRAERYLFWAGGIVREQTVDLARQHEPHRSHELEQALNLRLSGQRWPRQGNLPYFTVQVRVSPDERVRERLRPYWEDRIKLECDHELEKIKARQADDLTRRWCGVLLNLEDDPVTAHAARLTGEQFAEVYRRYVAERRETVPELVELLREAVRGHNDLGMGPSEYTQAWDTALRTYERQHGLDDRTN